MKTNQETPQAKRKFKVEISRGGTFDIDTLAQSQLPNGHEIEDQLSRSFFDNNSIFCVAFGFEEPTSGDNWVRETTDESGRTFCCEWHDFQINVYDENDNIVFSSDRYSDFRFVYDDVTKNDYKELATRIDLDVAQYLIFAKKCGDLERIIGRGASLADYAYSQLFIMSASMNSGVTREFFVEDVEFDPRKLVFVENAALKGIGPNGNHAVTDFEHIMYYDKFLVPDDDWSTNGYSTFDYIFELKHDSQKRQWQWKYIKDYDNFKEDLFDEDDNE